MCLLRSGQEVTGDVSSLNPAGNNWQQEVMQTLTELNAFKSGLTVLEGEMQRRIYDGPGSCFNVDETDLLTFDIPGGKLTCRRTADRG